MRTDAEAKDEIVQITNELFSMGLLTPTGGNISARSADADCVWITPSRLYKGGLAAEDLVCIRSDGTVVAGTNTPSVEDQMHWAAYAARPESTAAVPTHPPVATPLRIPNHTVPPINTHPVFPADTK